MHPCCRTTAKDLTQNLAAGGGINFLRLAALHAGKMHTQTDTDSHRQHSY